MNAEELLEEISRILRINSSEARKFVSTAPYRYKYYEIEKSSGEKRSIHHPTPALKAVQRWLVKKPLSALPVHPAVFSYCKKKNIKLNASEHRGSNYFARFDLKNFFPSIDDRALYDFLYHASSTGNLDLDKTAIKVAIRLLCRHDKELRKLALTIGAPSSPHISNAILYNLDCVLAEAALFEDAVYTRYADDIYFSAKEPHKIGYMEGKFREEIKRKFPYLSINEKKVQHFSRKSRVRITGITISSERRISLGREKKRQIKTEVHLALSGGLPSEKVAQLRGFISHAMSVEPAFYQSLKTKFGPKFELFMLRLD